VLTATAATELVQIPSTPLDIGIRGQNCEVTFIYNGTGSSFKAYVEQSAAKISSDITLFDVATTGAQPVSINFPCPANATPLELVFESTAAGTIKLDDLYLGEATNIGSAAQAEVVLKAFRTSTGQTVSTTNETAIIFNSSSISNGKASLNTSTGLVTVNVQGIYQINSTAYISGFNADEQMDFRVRRNGSQACYQGLRNGTGSEFSPSITCVLNLSVGDTIDVTVDSASDNSYTVNQGESATWLEITRFPTASEQVLKIGALGSEWTAFTPVVSHGSGSSSNITHSGFYKCDGSNLQMITQHQATGGTGTWSEFRIATPSNFTVDTTRALGNNVFGSFYFLDNSPTTVFMGDVAYVSSTNTVRLWLNQISTFSGTQYPTRANLENTIPVTWASNDTLRTNISIPVNECPRTPMPLVKNAVTTSSEGVERIERVNISGASPPSNCTSGPCTIETTSVSGVSVARPGTGNYTITWPAGTFSAKGSCSCSANNVGAGGPRTICTALSNNETTVTVNTYREDTGGAADSYVQVLCQGPR
jgi:hypothetical protein